MFKVSDYPINAFMENYRAELRAQGVAVDFQPFAYAADFVPLLATATVPQVNTTEPDSSFAVFKTMQTTHNAAAGNAYIPFPNLVVRITDDTTGQSLEDRPVQINAIFGRGQRPFIWDRPLVIGPKSSWTTTLSNLDAAIDVNCRLAYWGVKIFTKRLR